MMITRSLFIFRLQQKKICTRTMRRGRDNVPLLTVVADGCCSNRSYRTNYNPTIWSDVDSNTVEHYTSSVAMFTGGKRTNLIQQNANKIRCATAVVRHNTGTPFYKLHEVMVSSSPGIYAKKYESSVKREAERGCNGQTKRQKVRRSLQLSAPT
ncbi:hypothetical protein J6590_065977 [Homalodisca vitripennis]|nr:hypothetical protein J6590_065977 [Homalodisca vitripennis]